MAIDIPPDAKKQSIESIQRYFEENLDREVGDLQAGLLLDFFLEEIAPCVYNQAIADAQAFFQEKVADLDGARFEKEFSYWTTR